MAMPLPSDAVCWPTSSHLASTKPVLASVSVANRASSFKGAVPRVRVMSPNCQKIRFFSRENVPTGFDWQPVALAPSSVSASMALLKLSEDVDCAKAGFKA